MARVEKGALAHLADGAPIRVRVTPRGGRETIEATEDPRYFKVRVTVAAEGGKANKAVTALLARAIGVPPSAVVMVSGAKSRDKVFRVDI